MDVIVAAIGFPGVFLLLAVGWGLLVDRLAARSLHGALVVPVGFAAIVVASQLLTRRDGLSDATPYVLLVVGVAGLLVGLPRIRGIRRIGEVWEAAAAFALAYGIAIAPVLFSGRPTITAYLRDTTPGTHLAGAYGLIEHGASFAHEPATSDGDQLRAYYDNAYPSGGHTALAGVGRLFHTDLMWLFQPFLALCLAVGAPALWLLARRLGVGRVLAIVAAVVASVPAITYAYALQGSIKEIAFIPVLSTIPALLVLAPSWVPRGWRATLPLAVVGGAGIGAVGVAAGPWILVGFGLAALVALVSASPYRGFGRREAFVAVAGLVVFFGLSAAPALSNFVSSINVARSFSQSNAAAASDPGNLYGPLHAVQALGVWLYGDQRALPDVHIGATYAFVGVVALALAFGVVELVRRRAWAVAAWLVGTCVIWWVLTRRGTIWTDAKLLVLVAPTLVFIAFVGAASLRPVTPLLSLVTAGAISFGVLWSDGIMYHETNLIPTARYDEVLKLDQRYAGRGPAWVPDFDEYLFSALRRTHLMSPGLAYDPPGVGVTASGQLVPYGSSEDLDDAPLQTLEQQPVIIERASPERSRPPLNYVLMHDGQWQAWERHGPAPLAHLGANQDADPTGIPACRAVRALARKARTAGTDLVVARRPATVVRNLGRTASSPNWGRTADGVMLKGPGQITTTVRVPRAGAYRIWLRGDVARPVAIQVDGRTVGSVGYQSGGIGSYVMPVTARLSAGGHAVRLVRGGGTLKPGDGGVTILHRLVLEQAPVRVTLTRVPSARWRGLCGQRVDWIEVAPAR